MFIAAVLKVTKIRNKHPSTIDKHLQNTTQKKKNYKLLIHTTQMKEDIHSFKKKSIKVYK